MLNASVQMQGKCLFQLNMVREVFWQTLTANVDE